MAVDVRFVQDTLRGDNVTEIRMKFIKRIEENLPAGDEWRGVVFYKERVHLQTERMNHLKFNTSAWVIHGNITVTFLSIFMSGKSSQLMWPLS